MLGGLIGGALAGGAQSMNSIADQVLKEAAEAKKMQEAYTLELFRSGLRQQEAVFADDMADKNAERDQGYRLDQIKETGKQSRMTEKAKDTAEMKMPKAIQTEIDMVNDRIKNIFKSVDEMGGQPTEDQQAQIDGLKLERNKLYMRGMIATGKADPAAQAERAMASGNPSAYLENLKGVDPGFAQKVEALMPADFDAAKNAPKMDVPASEKPKASRPSVAEMGRLSQEEWDREAARRRAEREAASKRGYDYSSPDVAP